MRLISLVANKKSFKPIKFNESGLSIIIGKQKDPEQSDSGKTYNGVGKSLVIALIHFCLGTNKNKNFETAIPGWEFILEFKIKGELVVSKRSTSEQNRIFLNGEKMGVKKFCEKLKLKLFDIPEPVPFLKFRPLIKRFIRPNKNSYISFDSADINEQMLQKLICNAFLLGIETSMITEKYSLRKNLENIKTFQKNLKKDSVFVEFFTENKNVEIELKDIEEKVRELEKELSAFRVAENYYEIQKTANDTKQKMERLKNKAFVIKNAVKNIELSLKVRPDISPEKVLKIYEQAKTAMPNAVKKDIQEVHEFHNKLIANRIKRLTSEKSRLNKVLKPLNTEIAKLAKDMDSKLQYLSTHGALDEFVSLSNLLSDYKAKDQKIKDYKVLLEKYDDEIQDINEALNRESKKAKAYLKDVESLTDSNLETFRSFSRRFYPDKPGGLTVKNNDKDNQIRFDIEASIQDDASDGINQAKIFCFDMTVLTSRYNHHVESLFHDSRLFAHMDPRQRASLFKIAYEQTNQDKGQYIASVNEDQVLSMKDQFTDQEFERIITDNIVLELTDESPESKLLGIQVDMGY